MSHVEIYVVRENGDVEDYGIARNAHGGARHIWMVLAEKYKHVIKTTTPAGFFDPEPLWAGIAMLPESDRWVLASTFDNVIIQKEWLPTVITHLKAFNTEHPSSTLEEELVILEQAAQDDAVYGVCFNQTSVNGDAWIGPYVEAADDYEQYNINRHTDHWFLLPDSF